MKKTIFKDNYPIWSYTLDKANIAQHSIPEILSYFKGKIDTHPTAQYLAVFDHYAHTERIQGPINPDIKDMQIIIFCFGPEIPTTQVSAVRPRSIGVSELDNSFVIEFMEAPSPKAQETMEQWTKALAIA